MSVRAHERACRRLLRTPRHDGLIASGDCIVSLPDGAVIRPDLTLAAAVRPGLTLAARHAGGSAARPWVPSADVLLVAEVTSRASAATDRRVKPKLCAAAGIPYYLLVDRTSRHPAVTLYLDPAKAGYLTWCVVPAGPGGGTLAIPELGLTVDASRFPV